VVQSQSVRRSNPDAARLAADALVVATAAAEAEGPESQVLAFGLTASMARHGAGAADVVAALVAARRALIAVTGLDPTTEPVPLVVGDQRVAAINLAVYLHGLLDRGAAQTRTDRATVSARALAELRAR